MDEPSEIHPRALDAANAVCLDEVSRNHATYPSTSRLIVEIERDERERVLEIFEKLADNWIDTPGKAQFIAEQLYELIEKTRES